MSIPTPQNGPVTLREVYSLLERFRDEHRGDMRGLREEIILQNSSRDTRISSIEREINGEGDEDGIKTRLTKLEGRSSIIAILLGLLSVAGNSIAVWIGLRQQ